MIASKYRFKGQKGIMYVFRRGDTIRTKHCQIKFTTNSNNENYRASVVVSKKVSKVAPVRNRIRRRLYEQIRLQAPKYLTNQDIVITVYDPELANCEADDIKQLVSRILKTVRSQRH